MTKINLRDSLRKPFILDYSQVLNQMAENKSTKDNLSALSCFYQKFGQIHYTKKFSKATSKVVDENMMAFINPLGVKFQIDFNIKNPKMTLPNILINTKYNKSNKFKDNDFIKNYIMPEEEILCTDGKKHDLHSILKQKEQGILKCTYCNHSLKRNKQIVIFDDNRDKIMVYGKNCFERYNGINNLYNVLIYFINDFDYFTQEILPFSLKIKNKNSFKEYLLNKVKERKELTEEQYSKVDLFIKTQVIPIAFRYVFCNLPSYNKQFKQDGFGDLTDFFNSYDLTGQNTEDYQQFTSKVNDLIDIIISKI